MGLNGQSFQSSDISKKIFEKRSRGNQNKRKLFFLYHRFNSLNQLKTHSSKHLHYKIVGIEVQWPEEFIFDFLYTVKCYPHFMYLRTQSFPRFLDPSCSSCSSVTLLLTALFFVHFLLHLLLRHIFADG